MRESAADLSRLTHGAGTCDHARYHNAGEIEGRLRRLILDLVSRPEVIMKHVREDVTREKERLRNSDRERAAWAKELEKVERRRDAYVEMRADGDITKEEFRHKVAELDARKVAAKRELSALGAGSEGARYLDSLPALVEEYIRELPDLVHGREGTVRDYVTDPPERTKDNPHGLYRLTPEHIRRRTPEEMEELRLAEERERGRRYRAVYDLLGLGVVVCKDGTLEVSGTFGLRETGRGGEPESVWISVIGKGANEVPPPDDPSWDEERRCHDPRSPRPAPSRGIPGAQAGSGRDPAPPP